MRLSASVLQIESSRCVSCFSLCRLGLLIHQELTERGHLHQFLNKLCVLEDNEACAQAISPTAEEIQASETVLLPSNTVLPLSGYNSFIAAHESAPEPQALLATAEAHHEVSSMSANADSLAAECPQDIAASTDNPHARSSGVPSSAPSVLDAAMAAYKQEKRQLWKVCAQILLACS